MAEGPPEGRSEEYYAASTALVALYNAHPDLKLNNIPYKTLDRFADNPVALKTIEVMAQGLIMPFQSEKYANLKSSSITANRDFKYCLENMTPEIMAAMRKREENFFNHHDTFLTFLKSHQTGDRVFKAGTEILTPMVLRFPDAYKTMRDNYQESNLAQAALLSPKGMLSIFWAENEGEKPTRVVEKFKNSRLRASLNHLTTISTSMGKPAVDLNLFVQIPPDDIEAIMADPDSLLFQLPPPTSKDDADDESIWEKHNELAQQPSEDMGEMALEALDKVRDKKRLALLEQSEDILYSAVPVLEEVGVDWVRKNFLTEELAEFFLDKVKTFKDQKPAPSERDWYDFCGFYQHLPVDAAVYLWKKPDDQLVIEGTQLLDYDPLVKPLGRIFRNSPPPLMPEEASAGQMLEYNDQRRAWDDGWKSHLEAVLLGHSASFPAFAQPFIEEDQGKAFAHLLLLHPDRANALFALTQKLETSKDESLKGRHPMQVLQEDLNALLQFQRNGRNPENQITLRDLLLEEGDELGVATGKLAARAEGEPFDAKEYDRIRSALLKQIQATRERLKSNTLESGEKTGKSGFHDF